MLTKQFIRDLAERAIKTAAQAAVGVLAGTTLGALDWGQAGMIVATATVASVLSSVASAGVGAKGSPSLIPEVPLVEPRHAAWTKRDSVRNDEADQ